MVENEEEIEKYAVFISNLTDEAMDSIFAKLGSTLPPKGIEIKDGYFGVLQYIFGRAHNAFGCRLFLDELGKVQCGILRSLFSEGRIEKTLENTREEILGVGR